MSENYDFLLIVSYVLFFLVIVGVIIFLCFKKFKGFLKEDIISLTEYKAIIKLSWIYVGVELPVLLFNFLEYNRFINGFEYVIIRPVYLVSSIIPVYIAVLLFYRKYYNPVGELDENKVLTEEAVSRIFDSKSFYKAISTSLPKGNKDEEYGFDYIPFMLQNLAEKRVRFQRSSKAFLITTISLSLVFVSITIFFGYILLNESSIGVYKELSNLNSEIASTDNVLLALKKDLSDNDYFKKNLSYDLNLLASPYKYLDGEFDSLHRLAYDIRGAVEEFNKTGDFNRLYFEVENYRDSIINLKTVKRNVKYTDILNTAYRHLLDFKKLRDKGISDMYSSQLEIKKILPQLQDEIKKPTNTQNELIKRLILSIVVISFFIAILRYFRGLYQSHYSEMLSAENEDLLIRKFYVTYKSSSSPEERKQVLSTFLTVNSKTPIESNKKKNISEENVVLKEVLNAVLKKF